MFGIPRHREKHKTLINFKVFNQHFTHCEQFILSYMLHIPINLDDLSCEDVIILYHKYKVLYGLYQIIILAKTTY